MRYSIGIGLLLFLLCRRYLLRISHNLLKYQEEQDDGKYRAGKIGNSFRKKHIGHAGQEWDQHHRQK